MKKKILRLSCQDPQNSVKRPEKWFRKKFRMDVCACVRTCVKTEKYDTPPPPILKIFEYVILDRKISDKYFFLSPEERF